MDALKIVKKYYSKLTILPSTLTIAMLFAAVLAVFTSVELVLYGFKALISLAALALCMLQVAVVSRKVFGARRVVGMALIGLALSTPSEVVGLIVGVPSAYHYTLYAFSSIVVSGVAGLGGALALEACQLATASILLALAYGDWYRRLLLSVAALAISSSILAVVKILGMKRGLDPLKLMRGFILAWFGVSQEVLENELEKYGEVRSVKIDVVKFCRPGRSIALVVPQIHYGPFRAVGSAQLPYYLRSEGEAKGLEILPLHGAGSHELNLVHHSDAQKIASEVVEVVEKLECQDYELVEPYRVSDGFREAFVVATPKHTVSILLSPTTGGDDLPSSIDDLAEAIAKSGVYERVTVVDAHNVEGKPVEDPRAFEEVLRRALTYIPRPCNELRVGLGVASTKIPVRGLCSRRVYVLAIECNGKVYALVVLFGNNAAKGVREAVRRELISMGAYDAELLTIDDHSCAATARDEPYHVVHLDIALLSAIKEAFRRALEDLKPATIASARLYRQVLVMGSSVSRFLLAIDHLGRVVLTSVAALALLSTLFVVIASTLWV